MNKHKSVFLFLLYGVAGLALYFFIKKTFFLLFPIFFAFLCSEGIRGSFARLHPLAAPVKRILTVLLLLIFFGYIAGIVSKLVNEAYMAAFADKWYVLFFYVLNFIMVGADLVLYVRNYRLDQAQKTKEN